MHLRCAVLFAAIALVLAATPSLADMVIKLRDGHVITVPIQPGDIELLSFTGPNREASTTPGHGGAHLPANAHVFPPMKPARPSGRVLYVGPNRDLKVPSQAAHEAKDGGVHFVHAAHYDYHLRADSPAIGAAAIPYQP